MLSKSCLLKHIHGAFVGHIKIDKRRQSGFFSLREVDGTKGYHIRIAMK
jgi:hypothetical protein